MRHRSLLLLVAASLAVAACGSDDDATPADASDPVVVDTTAPTPDTTDAPDATTTPTSGVPATSVPGGMPGGVPADLVGIRWVVESGITVGGLRPLPAGADVTFGEDGRVSVHTGCNQGSATATFVGEYQLTLGPIGLTKMACTDDGRSSLESAVLAVIEEPLSWSVDEGKLKLIPLNITDVGLVLAPASGDSVSSTTTG